MNNQWSPVTFGIMTATIHVPKEDVVFMTRCLNSDENKAILRNNDVNNNVNISVT